MTHLHDVTRVDWQAGDENTYDVDDMVSRVCHLHTYQVASMHRVASRHRVASMHRVASRHRVASMYQTASDDVGGMVSCVEHDSWYQQASCTQHASGSQHVCVWGRGRGNWQPGSMSHVARMYHGACILWVPSTQHVPGSQHVCVCPRVCVCVST